MDKRRVAKETFSKIGGAFAADLVPCQVEPRHSSVDLQNVSCGISQISASQLFICVSMRAEYRMCGLVGCCSKCSPSLRTGASLSPPPVKSSARTPCVSREASSAKFWATCASRMGLIHLPCALNLSHQDGLASIRKTEGSADWRSDAQVTAHGATQADKKQRALSYAASRVMPSSKYSPSAPFSQSTSTPCSLIRTSMALAWPGVSGV